MRANERVIHGRSHRTMAAACSLGVLCFVEMGCTRSPKADLAKARPVMERFLQAEREHRASHGNFWRDRQPQVQSAEAMRNLGVDLSDAAEFEFVVDPPEDGMDTVLRVTARGRDGDSSVSLSCVQPAARANADCKESAGTS